MAEYFLMAIAMVVLIALCLIVFFVFDEIILRGHFAKQLRSRLGVQE